MRKNRKVGITLSYAYFVVSTIIGIFVSSFIVRTIGKTNYGVYQSMTAFVSYLALLEFGTGTIMSRNLSMLKKDGTDDEDIKRNVSTIWTLTSILSIVICCVAIVFYYLIPVIYSKSFTIDQIVLGKNLFIFAVVSLLCSFNQQMMNGILLGNEFYVFEKAVSLIKLFIRTALVIVILNIRPSIYCLVIIDTIISLIVIVSTYTFIKVKLRYKFTYSSFDMAIFKVITPLCLAMLLQTIVNTANGSIDKFLISIMMTPEDVSVYAIAMLMFSMFSSIATLPVTMYMPQVAKSINAGLKGRELTETLVQPCRLNTLITGLIAFGFAVVGKQFIVILYGEDYAPAWLFAMVIIFPMFLNMSNAVIINVLDILNKRHVRSLILMITTTANIVITIIGIKLIGMIGAAIATGISLIGQIILLNTYYSRIIGLPVLYLFSRSFKGILIPLIISSIGAYFAGVFITNIYFHFFICGALFVVLFAVIFILLGANEYERKSIERVFSRYIGSIR